MADTGQTVPQVLQNLIVNQVEPNWPGINSVSGYYSTTTMKPTTPAGTPDKLLQWVLDQLLLVRDSDEPEFTRNALETAERQDVVDDILARIAKGQTQLTTVAAAITTYRAGI